MNRYEMMNEDRQLPTVNKRKVAAYCRVSTDHEDQANSFENQQRYFKQYIEHHPDWELFEVFADAADIIGLNQNPIQTGADLVLFFCFQHNLRRMGV